METPGFEIFAAEAAASPVVISVPHAGRDYPLPLRAALKVPLGALLALEDRYADCLALAARTGETMLVQRRARAWIDLNRAEDERDPRVDEGAPRTPSLASAKLRSGLGLVPRRSSAAGDLWRRRFSAAEVEARLATDHRPYHAAVAQALLAARARFGVAVLLDLHSMPPLGPGGPQVVIGDRFGRAAAHRFVHRIEAEAMRDGLGVALNTPYAGAFLLDRHGRPGQGIHAVQLELDRSLYLDRHLVEPGPGLSATAALLRRVLAVLADEALAGALPVAAE